MSKAKKITLTTILTLFFTIYIDYLEQLNLSILLMFYMISYLWISNVLGD